MTLVIPAPKQSSVAVHASPARFPVRRIYCVGRNYAAHAREMGNDEREPPFFFMKPADAVVDNGVTIPFPKATQDLHHEGELVVAIGAAADDIDVLQALDCVWGYGAGIDLTRRDIQSVAKKMARPWGMAKGFDHSAPCGPISPVAAVGHMDQGRITLTVNGEERQNGDLADMIWTVPETIAYLSGLVRLEPGDLIFTGTPAGVSELKRGDVCNVSIERLQPLTLTIAKS